jgi:hypothetical protein
MRLPRHLSCEIYGPLVTRYLCYTMGRLMVNETDMCSGISDGDVVELSFGVIGILQHCITSSSPFCHVILVFEQEVAVKYKCKGYRYATISPPIVGPGDPCGCFWVHSLSERCPEASKG